MKHTARRILGNPATTLSHYRARFLSTMAASEHIDCRTFSVAPMMDWTDRHYRYMMRMITKRALLYTEMVVDNTILHQQHNLERFLGHQDSEEPLALQLGGSDPESLAEAAVIAEAFGGFYEINLNVGCPSPKVAGRCFGARLMLNPSKVRKIVSEITRRVSATPVTVKCRIGVDEFDSYDYLHNFVTEVASAGVKHFSVHARKCLLEGLSPAENRTIPPLKYEFVYRLKEDFPELKFYLNGGITSLVEAENIVKGSDLLPPLDGVMVGRAAYQKPWLFRGVDTKIFGDESRQLMSRREIVENYVDYAMDRREKSEVSAMTLIKPLLGLFSGEPGGRAYKRRIDELYKQTKGSASIEEIVLPAMVESIPSHVLDDATIN